MSNIKPKVYEDENHASAMIEELVVAAYGKRYENLNQRQLLRVKLIREEDDDGAVS